MKSVIHVGMHKTGSSSIQHTFARLSNPDLEYIDWGANGNHSALFFLLFEDPDKAAEHQSFRARGAKFIRDLPALREEWHVRVSTQLAKTGDKTILFSAEAISLPRLQKATERLHEFFTHWSKDVSVIGYVRSPAGFLPSAFQEILKSGSAPDLLSSGVLPNYRGRFEKLDRVFGRDGVSLKEYSTDHLWGGDVVQDFAREIGLAPLAKNQIIRTNESLSLEAVALLYVQRKMGKGFVQGFDRAHAANNTFISRLATIGRRKFAFSPQMLSPVLEKERDDIAWMEDRLGHPFFESGAPHPDAIESLDDLVDIALEQYVAVQKLLGDSAVKDGPATIGNLVRALELLRERCYASTTGQPVENHCLEQKRKRRMSTSTETKEPTQAELDVRRKLAHVLWIQENEGSLPESLEERKEMFQSAKVYYLNKAGNLVRRLRNQGIELKEFSD